MASFSSTMASRALRPMPRSSSPIPTLSRTLRQGSKANCWNTMATPRERKSRRALASQEQTSTSRSPCATTTRPRAGLFKRLTARSSVDLPEPESPISTQISPGATASVAPATPTTWPVSARISSRVRPASRSGSTRFGFGPKMMSTASNEIAARGAGSAVSVRQRAAAGLRNMRSSSTATRTMAIPASKPMAGRTWFSDRSTGTPSPPDPTMVAMTDMDSASMMDCVRPSMMAGRACGSSTLRRSWKRRGAEGLARLAQRQRNRGDAELRHADRRRHGEDDGRDDAGHDAEAEQRQHRDEIDEGRQRLHQVEHRPQASGESGMMAGQDAERDADRHRGRRRIEGDHQRRQRVLPVALVEDEAERHEREDRHRPGSPQRIGDARDRHAEQRWRHEPGEVDRAADKTPERVGDVIEEQAGAVLQRIHAAGQPGADRDLMGGDEARDGVHAALKPPDGEAAREDHVML